MHRATDANKLLPRTSQWSGQNCLAPLLGFTASDTIPPWSLLQELETVNTHKSRMHACPGMYMSCSKRVAPKTAPECQGARERPEQLLWRGTAPKGRAAGATFERSIAVTQRRGAGSRSQFWTSLGTIPQCQAWAIWSRSLSCKEQLQGSLSIRFERLQSSVSDFGLEAVPKIQGLRRSDAFLLKAWDYRTAAACRVRFGRTGVEAST